MRRSIRSILSVLLALGMSCVGSMGRAPGAQDAAISGVWVPTEAASWAGLQPGDAGVGHRDAGTLAGGTPPRPPTGLNTAVEEPVAGDAGEPLGVRTPPRPPTGFNTALEGPVASDAGEPDAGVPDAGVPDAGVPDAGVPDAGVPDAGPPCIPLQGTITTLAKGTYCVTGDVIIPTGVTLDVPAGTTFIVMGRYHFGRDPALPDLEPPAVPGSGTLHAIGTAAEPIVFRGATPDTAWYGIVISHAHDTVHLEYVTIRDTYKNDTNVSARIWKRGGALSSYVNVHGTIIRHSTFINNRAIQVGGAIDLNGHGQWPNAGPVEITDSLFEDNACECVSTVASTSDDVCGGGGVRFSHVGGDANLVKLRNNVFRRNLALRSEETNTDAYGGGIGGFDDALIIGPGNVFDSNGATNGDGAISCNHQPSLGTIIDAVDPSVVFINNSPDNGCGQ